VLATSVVCVLVGLVGFSLPGNVQPDIDIVKFVMMQEGAVDVPEQYILCAGEALADLADDLFSVGIVHFSFHLPYLWSPTGTVFTQYQSLRFVNRELFAPCFLILSPGRTRIAGDLEIRDIFGE